MNRKAVCKKPRKKGFSVSVYPPRDARIHSFWWVFLALEMERTYAEKPQPLGPTNHSLFCFFFNKMILTIIIINIITVIIITSSSFLSLHLHYHRYHHHQQHHHQHRAGINSTDGCKVGVGQFFLQKKIAGNKCSQLCEP